MTAQSLPKNLYSAAQVRAMDHSAINEHGIPGAQLMKRAGRVCFEALLQQFPNPQALTVFCGGGNNGGDGYVIAALAQQANIPVRVVYLVSPDTLTGDAQRAFAYAQQEGVVCEAWHTDLSLNEGIVVDALLGTGLSGAVRGDYVEVINRINDAGLPVLAVDIPSGLHADTGAVLGAAVCASLTCTFIGLKAGLVTGEGPSVVGDLIYHDLEVPAQVLGAAATAERLCLEDLLAQLPERRQSAHKGSFGHALIIGGDVGYGGAAIMASQACARMGAGLTSLATQPDNTVACNVSQPEIMAAPIRTGVEVNPLLDKATVVAVGPGLGVQPWAEQLFFMAVQSQKTLVIDADALNLLAKNLGREILIQDRTRTRVLTPHPGEAGRLLNCTSGEIQADRFNAAKQLAEKYQAIVVLKGSGTVIATPSGELFVCDLGNPGMASGGMGDVLTGMIAGLLVQNIEPLLAVKLAVCLHGQAADDMAINFGQRGLLATDLIDQARALLNGF